MNFPRSNGLRDGIYLGRSFFSLHYDVETRRECTHSIYREKTPDNTPYNKYYKVFSSHDIPVEMYSDEHHTQSIPNASEDAMPTVIDESRSFAIDLRTLSPSQTVLEYKDKDWRTISTSLNKQDKIFSHLEGRTSCYIKILYLLSLNPLKLIFLLSLCYYCTCLLNSF